MAVAEQEWAGRVQADSQVQALRDQGAEWEEYREFEEIWGEFEWGQGEGKGYWGL